ncbi:MAG: bifunctional transcriptional activator/DNA repair protein Ada [Ignavibacteriae bacterium]|nr:bifunctional transcriptional activator/DNA repair protein Ada [Ignavibacteriota bacterium]MCB9244467.1 bifunctional transcriptional activator/DNA repair protein Ada [Ignavibacteriales bacterium]
MNTAEKLTKQLPSETEMLRAFNNSDRSYDGIFFTAVKTTSIFCRPSCRVKKPLKKNIEFYATAKEALFAGYRPCKRCKPMEIGNDTPDWVKKLMEIVDKNPEKKIRDYEMRQMGFEPSRARRFFKQKYGMTFHAYCRSRRLGKAFSLIRNGVEIADAVFDNGYDSHSGFRDAFSKTLGFAPGKSYSKDCMVTSLYESPLGHIILAANDKGLCLAEFSDRRMLEYQLKVLNKYFKSPLVPGRNKFIEQAESELEEYFKGNLKNFKVPIEYPGTEFQQKVWEGLRNIPYGTTVSYVELAKKVGTPKGSRPVGTANGMNRLAIIIPCHRVIKNDGSLGGYGGGLWRKKRLLELEGVTGIA